LFWEWLNPKCKEHHDRTCGSIEDLQISTTSSSIVIEFDTNIAKSADGKLTIQRTGFNDRLNPISELKVVLPNGYRLKEAVPRPEEVSKDYLLWYNVDYIPGIILVRSSYIKHISIGILLVLVFFVAVKLKTR
jgi:hypothetical protein